MKIIARVIGKMAMFEKSEFMEVMMTSEETGRSQKTRSNGRNPRVPGPNETSTNSRTKKKRETISFVERNGIMKRYFVEKMHTLTMLDASNKSKKKTPTISQQ
jgi:hypothetical protein